MTREEAVKKIGSIYDLPTASHLVEALEALGLIKFEVDNTIANQIGYSIFDDLKANNYKIVKLGKNTIVKFNLAMVENGTCSGKLISIEQS